MGRAQFEAQLVLLAEIDLLDMSALVQIPEMEPAAVPEPRIFSGMSPSSNMSGVPHSLVTMVS